VYGIQLASATLARFCRWLMPNAEACVLIRMSNDGSKSAFFELVSLEKFKDYRGLWGCPQF
jgi:hypothetical protein